MRWWEEERRESVTLIRGGRVTSRPRARILVHSLESALAATLTSIRRTRRLSLGIVDDLPNNALYPAWLDCRRSEHRSSGSSCYMVHAYAWYTQA